MVLDYIHHCYVKAGVRHGPRWSNGPRTEAVQAHGGSWEFRTHRIERCGDSWAYGSPETLVQWLRSSPTEVPMQMSESVTLLRALKEIQQGTGRIAKLLSEALSAEGKARSKPPKRLTIMKRRLKL